MYWNHNGKSNIQLCIETTMENQTFLKNMGWLQSCKLTGVKSMQMFTYCLGSLFPIQALLLVEAVDLELCLWRTSTNWVSPGLSSFLLQSTCSKLVFMFSHAFLSSIGAASDEEQAAVVSTCSYNKKGPQSNTVKKRVLHVMVMGFNCH